MQVAALAALFAIVQVGFWVIPTNLPIGKSDGMFWTAYINAVLHSGHLIGFGSQGLSYQSSWPLVPILTALVAQVTGVSVPVMMILTIMMALVATSIFVYMLAFELIRNTFYSFLAASLFYFASLNSMNSLYTSVIVPLGLVAGFLWLVARIVVSRRGSTQLAFILGVLMLAISGGEFLASAFLSFLLIGLKFAYRKNISMLLVALNFLAWMLPLSISYGALYTFTSQLSGNLGNIMNWTDWLSFYHGKVTYGLPQWIGDLTVFWQLIIALPLVFSFLLLLPSGRSHLSTGTKFLSSCFVAIAPFAVLLSLEGAGGFALNFQYYFPFLSVGLIAIGIRYISLKNSLIAGIVVLLIISLTLPTFLVYNRNQEVSKLYPTDSSGYSYLQTYFKWDSHQELIASYFALPFPFEANTTVISFYPFALENASSLFGAWQVLLRDIGPPSSGNVFYFSQREVVPWSSLLGVFPSDSRWTTVMHNLSNHNAIYSNGGVTLYG